jgi:Protein of unknown function (DUF3800)
MIYAAYFDESDDRPGFSLAGYSASYDTWLHLDWKWRDLLKHWNLEYFKASECENGWEQFAQYRDNPEDRRKPLKPNERERLKEIKTQFVDAICKHQDDLQGYGAVVVLKDFNKLITENEFAYELLSDSPYYVCFQLCLVAAAMPARDANMRRAKRDHIEVRPIFDSHEEYSGMAKVLFDKFSKKNPKSAEVLLPPSYDDDRNTSPLQVADTLAYEARKLLTRIIRNPEDDYMRVPMQRLLPSVYRLYRLDYDSLKAIVARQPADSVPLRSLTVKQLL